MNEQRERKKKTETEIIDLELYNGYLPQSIPFGNTDNVIVDKI